jgi:ribonuclease Z
MFELTVLGTSSAMPTPERSLSCIAVRKDGEIFLLDCGEGSQRQMMRFSVSYMKIRAIFITHLHLDHFLGAFGLLETLRLNGRKEKLTIYAPRGAAGVFGRKEFLEVKEIGGKWSGDFGGFTVSSFATKHPGGALGFVLEEKEKVRFHEEKAHALGLKGPMFSEIQKKGKLTIAGKAVKLKDVTYTQPGKKIVFSGDSAPCAALAKAAKGADLLIHESTFGSDKAAEAKETSHSTAQDAAACAKKAGAKRLLLTHFSGRYADTSQLLAEAKAIFPAVDAANDGMKLEVGAMLQRAQGATEYLVLLAVVLIVALVSVALLGFFPGMASDSQIAQNQIYWRSATPIAVVETPGAYAYTPNTAYAMAYWRIKNNGNYPIRLVKILGQGGSYASEYQYGNLTDIYLSPGEETCFTHAVLPAITCQNGGPYRMYFGTGSGIANTHSILNGAKTVCNADGTGNLDIPQFGFEYIEYIDGQQITKRQIGAKNLIIKCVGKT